MTSSLLDAPPVRIGAQRPRISHLPSVACNWDEGDDAAFLAESCGLILDDWQVWCLKQILSTDQRGKWAPLESCLIVPRQNGKGSILEALELYGLFQAGIKLILHSAHELKTAKEHYRRMKSLIQANSELAAEVLQWRESNEEISIELKNGAKLRFIARSKGGGRGFTGDWNIFDEAYALDGDQLAALMPTMSARPNPLIIYTSSAGMAASEVLGKLQKRGHSGKGARFFYAEWSIDYSNMDAIDIADRDGWYQANPALGIRLTEEFTEAEMDAMEADPEAFARERLGVWFDGTIEAPVTREQWDALADPEGKIDPGRRPAFAFEVSHDRKRASISQAGYRDDDGIPQVELVQKSEKTGWVVPRILELRERANPCAVIIDAKSPTAPLITKLAEELFPDIEPDDVTKEMFAEERIYLIGSDDLARACGQFIDAVLADPMEDEEKPGTFRHLGDNILADSLESSTMRDLAGGIAFDRKTFKADITPITSAALALYGLALHGAAIESRPPNIW